MAPFKSIVCYDGTRFHGFQRQRAGQRTVQAVLEAGLRRIGWRQESISAAGRTDAGAHARGQVIAYDIEWRHGPSDLSRALNANLPPDVAVWATERAPEGFHPRRSASGRRYSYHLIFFPHRQPLRERFAWRVWPEPTWEGMQRAAALFEGTHDFRAFGRPPKPGGDTRRRIFSCEWTREENAQRLDVVGDGFMKHMVRRMVAAMLSVGWERLGVEDVRSLLSFPERRWQGDIAPAKGLCLEEVIYPEIAAERRETAK
jgi:tRNA pseudouridine38-40 synthase